MIVFQVPCLLLGLPPKKTLHTVPKMFPTFDFRVRVLPYFLHDSE